jgi:hypothetical protein
VPDIIGEFEIENVPIGPIEFFKTFGQVLVISGHEFSGDSQTVIELVVDVGYNELGGVVYDEFYNAVPGATVVLNWKHNYQGVVSIVTRRSTTRPTGEFLFQGLGKGEHELLVTSGKLYFTMHRSFQMVSAVGCHSLTCYGGRLWVGPGC